MKDYSEFKDEMILRDYLAYDRTKLALTRTVLSIARTALGLLASGAGLVITKENEFLVSLGYVLISTAVIVMLLGFGYWYKFKRRLDNLQE